MNSEEQKMNSKRYKFLREHHDEKLTQEEIDDGWFFCCEWDGLLIHKTHPEASVCSCMKINTVTGVVKDEQ